MLLFFSFLQSVRSTQVEQMSTAWMVDRMMHMGMVASLEFVASPGLVVL